MVVPTISALGRLRQENSEFEAILGNSVRPCLKNAAQQNKNNVHF
jgi:hypothetical protein